MARNFFVTDTVLETPPTGLASAVYDKADQTDFLSSFSGLGAVSDDIRALLPAECRSAFDNAVEQENQWKSRWGPERPAIHAGGTPSSTRQSFPEGSSRTQPLNAARMHGKRRWGS
uniref:Uncharacterized protein n=1 Tax=Bionectria ochroleuca TaxID=29856 RepID=A0A8H7NCT4_BIOOC